MAQETMIRPRRFSLRVILLLIAVIGLFCALIVRPLVSLDRTLQSEYGTQKVIQVVEQYVRTHGGKWPKSWADLDQAGNSRYANYTRVNFDLNSEDLLKNRSLIYSAIAPATGEYVIYPHVRRSLDSLLETISESIEAARLGRLQFLSTKA